MSGLGYTWQTITWRVAGLIFALTLFYLWVRTGEVWMAGLGLVGFAASWFIAAWLDVHTICCTPTRPHTKQDYGEGQHWVTEKVR